MKKLIFTILFFISVQLQSQNTSNNDKSSYTFDKALKQFVGFCKIQIDTESPSDGNYIQFCIMALELQEKDMSYLTKSTLKQEVEKVLSDNIIKNKFLKNIAKISACDLQRISFLIHPPANDDRYVVKVSANDAQILSQYIYSNFCNTLMDNQAIAIAEAVKKAEQERLAREVEETKKKELLSRKYVYRPMIINSTNDTGKVIVDIKVDSLGNVIYAKYKLLGSTTSNIQLINLSEQAALKTKFNAVTTKEVQESTIAYIFTSK